MAKIGIFDSGYGGLTILEAIRRELPQYDYLYLGDNARAPYGTHSFDVIYRYTLQAVKYLFSQDCALVILACNTASAKALRTIQQKDLPEINHKFEKIVPKGKEIINPKSSKHNVLGVIRPTVEAVPAITKTGHIGILATPATVSSESYVLELEKIAKLPNDQINDQMVNAQPFTVVQQACPLWVPLIENGEHLNPGACCCRRSVNGFATTANALRQAIFRSFRRGTWKQRAWRIIWFVTRNMRPSSQKRPLPPLVLLVRLVRLVLLARLLAPAAT